MGAERLMNPLLIAALTCAFAAGTLIASLAIRSARTARLRGLAHADAFGAVRLFLPAARWMLARISMVSLLADYAVAVLSARGVDVGAEAAVSAALAAATCAGLVSGLAARSVFWGMLAAAGVAILAATVVSAMFAKDREALRDRTPQVLQSLGRCLAAGLTLQQTFRQVGEEVPGQVGRMFATAAHRLETGAGASEALGFLRTATDVEELRFLAVALDVQHRTGGSMRQVLESARETVLANLDLSRQLRVQTAQARLSARVVTLLPFGLLAVLQLLSPGFMDPFFSGVAGGVLLGVALLLQAAGILMVRRILKGAER